jgi:acyl-CoA synthetase (AMP-forming)/AMP-acid ligase II
MRLAHRLEVAATLYRTGMVRPARPRTALRLVEVLHRWGPTLAAGYMSSAIRYPERLAVIDEQGTVTFGELQRRTNALANALARHGVGEGDGLAIMCRNSRAFIEAMIAASKLGARSLLVNTELMAPVIARLLDEHHPPALIYDADLAPVVLEGARDVQRFVAVQEPEASASDVSLEELVAQGARTLPRPPAARARTIVLTSGTTGTPKGALRPPPSSVEPAAAVFSTIPLRARETTVIAPPLFHSWGLAHLTLGAPLSSTLVLRRRFDAEETLQAVARERASTLVLVPVMLQRMLALPAQTLDALDLSCLRVIASSGSVLPGELSTRAMDVLGDVLYNLYGSTEAAWVSVAGPEDLRAAPGTAGRPPLGTSIRLLDEHRREVPRGAPGRIFVSNGFGFEGYTDGSGREVIDGYMHTGDVGHFDEQGRLFVDGRDDEMIVSGGENVYPREVEDLLAGHAQIAEAAVVGVADSDFGQRLRAFVVLREDAELDEDGVKRLVRENLARYKVPRDVIFLPALPRNATGKILKRELATFQP